MNILHGCVVDATTSGSHDLLLATGCMIGVALSLVLLWSGAFSSEVAGTFTVEASVAGDSHSRWCW
jgi:hypothetical protein